MKYRIFEIFQRLGRSFMLPISILPFAGLLLGIGMTMTNSTIINTYGLGAVAGEGTMLYLIFSMFTAAGHAIFDNLPILFAVGVAIGMSRQNKEIAAIAAVLAFLVMHYTIHTCLVFYGDVYANGVVSPSMLQGSVSDVLGITTLNMGVFGGIIIGIGVAYLNNHYHMVELPEVLSFFEGNRFVLLISCVTYLVTGFVLYYIWPYVQISIYHIGNLVSGSHYFGTFIYGFVKRCLIPFGLHHVFYLPFWQTGIGGSMMINGKIVQGAQNIFFAQLANPNTVTFSLDACRFFSGEFIFMIMGLPGAALAMYQCAEVEQKKKVAGLLFTATCTCILTGITEPLEFSFLFVTPLLYLIHCFLAGFAYMIAHMLHIAVGLTFSGGVLDLILFGILQGNEKTHWIYILPVGILYFFLYYGIFRFLIIKLDLKTPGREKEAVLHTKEEYRNRMALSKNDRVQLLINGLGGLSNIELVDSCATRLRCTVIDKELVDQDLIRKTGSFGIMQSGCNLQIIYGPKVGKIRKTLDHMLSFTEPEGGPSFDNHVKQDSSRNHLGDLESIMVSEDRDFQWTGELQPETIFTFARGQVIPLESVDDIVFSSGLLGDGYAILPADSHIYAPVDGIISFISKTGHAITIISEHGAEILIHIGIDTVRLQGQGFHVFVEVGQSVKQGELLVTFDKQLILEKGYSLTSPLIINNTDSYANISSVISRYVVMGEEIMTLEV